MVNVKADRYSLRLKVLAIIYHLFHRRLPGGVQTVRPSTEFNDCGGGGSQIITVVINQPQLTPAHPMREGVVPESPADWRYVDSPVRPGESRVLFFARCDSRRRKKKTEEGRR